MDFILYGTASRGTLRPAKIKTNPETTLIVQKFEELEAAYKSGKYETIVIDSLSAIAGEDK